MPTTLQLRRGTTAEQNAFTGAVGEVTVDTTTNELRVHDGSTQGGHVVGEGDLNSYVANTEPRIAWLDSNGEASAALIPATNNAIDLGSAGRVWRDVYIGPGSLYVNGKKVIEDDSDTITITTDINQNLKVATSGSGVNQIEAGAGGISMSTGLGSSGDITINADGNIELLSTVQIQSTKRITDSAGTKVEYGDAIEMNGNKIIGLGTPTAGTDAATKAYVDGAGGITQVTYTSANGNFRIQTNDGVTHDATISTGDKMEVANTQALFTTVSSNVSQAFSDIQATNTAIRALVTSNDNDISALQTVDGNQWSAITSTNTAIRAITTTNANKISQVEANLLASNTAIRGYVDSEVAALVDSAPATLDTLNELAAALGDDPSFATTISTNIGQKLGATASVTLTGDVTGSASFSANAVSITTTVADDSHNHIISNVDGLQDALNNKMSVANTQALANSRLGSGASVTLTGDVSGTASFSSNAVSITTVVADDSHNHVISNVDGLQTALDGKEASITGAATTITGSNLTASRAVVSDGSGKVAVSAVTSTELGYLDGVTSAIQTQLNGKQATITGAATTIDDTNLTASRALVSDGSGKVAVSAVTSTELGYLDGVTSAIQTQLNAKAATSSLGALATLSTVNAATITDNSVGAAELNVSGNGTTAQFLRSDGDGTFTWATPTDTNTTYSAGSGLDLSGTTFAVEPDLRDGITHVGRDTNDYIAIGTTTIGFFLDGAEDMRLTNNGQLDVEGSVVAHSSTVSDERLKENIVPIEGALDIVKQLGGYSYNYKKDGKPAVGLIAQEVQKVVPSAVTETEIMGHEGEQHLVLEYTQLIGVLVEAIKDQQEQIEDLKGKLTRE